jgi:hypothetical protein
VFCELLFTLRHTVASERKVVRPMYLEQTETVTLNSFLQLSRKLTDELKAWEIHIVCKICKAKFEEKFPLLQDKNYVAMLWNIFKNVRGPLRSYTRARVWRRACWSAEVQNLTLDFVSNKSPVTAAILWAKVRETVGMQEVLAYIPAYMKTLR